MMTERERTLMGFARCAMAEPQDDLRPGALLVSLVVGAAMWGGLIALAFFLLDTI